MQEVLPQLTADNTNCDNMSLHFSIGVILQEGQALLQFTAGIKKATTFNKI